MPRKKKSSSSENHRSASASSVSINKDKPVQRNAANARERARMRVLSRAFCRLKTTLPWVPADTKLSKLDTLRLAASYIAHLKGILDDDPFGPDDPIHPAMNLTWPFGFNRGGGNGSGGGGSGSEDAEESGSSCAWEEVTKDCVHLDPEEDDPSLHLHHLNSSSQLHHLTPNSNSTPSHNHSHGIDHNHNHHGQNTGPGSENGPGNGNGNVIPFNPQHSHHQHPQSHMIPSNSMIPCYHDDIMSIG